MSSWPQWSPAGLLGVVVVAVVMVVVVVLVVVVSMSVVDFASVMAVATSICYGYCWSLLFLLVVLRAYAAFVITGRTQKGFTFQEWAYP